MVWWKLNVSGAYNGATVGIEVVFLNEFSMFLSGVCRNIEKRPTGKTELRAVRDGLQLARQL